MAVINDRFHYLFLAEPRTASRAMRDALLTHPGSREIGSHHASLRTLKSRYRLRRADRYYTFSVVRNPADILVTEWFEFGAGRSLFEYIRDRLYYCSDSDNPFFKHASTVKHFLHYEELQVGLDTLFGGLGIPFVVLPVVGKTLDKEYWRTYYSPETLHYLQSNCSEVSKFGYFPLTID